VPDARASELRTTLLVILSKLAAAAATVSPSSSPPSKSSPEQSPQFDQKLIDEINQWRKDYNEWLKGAAKTYTAAS